MVGTDILQVDLGLVSWSPKFTCLVEKIERKLGFGGNLVVKKIVVPESKNI